jgi:predicted methyltransferase
MNQLRLHLGLALAVLVFAGCKDEAPPPPQAEPAPSITETAPAPEPAATDLLRAAIDSDKRPAEDRERDPDRKPYEVLTFFGIEPAMTVAELMTGRGYYAEILGRAVGPTGTVYAHNNAFVLERFAEGPLSERLQAEDLVHVIKHDAELHDLELPAAELDAILIILFYHDTFWQGVDREAMLREVRAALKPGGIFGVIDHHAAADSGDRDVKTLHRIDAEMLEAEILAAGFELEAESDLLRHPDDDRTVNVFEDAIRGKTDRFVYKFRKPDQQRP